MIKINMLSKEQQAANELMFKFQKAFRERASSQRIDVQVSEGLPRAFVLWP